MSTTPEAEALATPVALPSFDADDEDSPTVSNYDEPQLPREGESRRQQMDSIRARRIAALSSSARRPERPHVPPHPPATDWADEP